MLEVKVAKNKMENEEGMNHLLMKVTPEISNVKIEKPIAFILVVDVSGSMDELVGTQGGQFGNFQVRNHILNDQEMLHVAKSSFERVTKLDYVKQASEKLVDMMKEGDMLGVVSFSDTASLEYPLTKLNQDVRFKLKDRIRALQVRGMTNVSDGLELAYRQIPSELKETHHIKLLLLSDGHANYGITGADAIGTLASGYRENDVSVSTIGVGNDYNSYFMEVIATTSGGMFYHLKDMTQLNELFTKELELLTSLTTKQATLRIAMSEGIKVEENLNGFKEENGSIYIGNVFSEQQILTEIYTEKEIAIGDRSIHVTLEYINQDGEKKIVEQFITLSIEKEEDMNDIQTDEEVVALVKQMMEAKVKKEALRNYESGDIQGATNGILQSKMKMKSLQASYSVDMDAVMGEMSQLENSMTTRSLNRENVKEMYSQSYNLTRNVTNDEK